MDSNTIEIVRLITEAEHHFNNLCFKIRTLASTWLLATFTAVGFILTKQGDFFIQRPTLIVLVCWAGAIGIFVLWILDLQIYQKLLNAWFNARKDIEEKNKELPQIHEKIKATQPGGKATNLIRYFYVALVSAPLIFELLTLIKFLNTGDLSTKILLIVSLIFLVGINVSILKLSSKDRVSKHE